MSKTAKNKGLRLDIRTIAAEVSWKYLEVREIHPVYNTMLGGFKIGGFRQGAPSPESFIVDSLACDDEDLFWKLNRACDCQGVSTAFLDVCACLAKQGLTLIFKDSIVTNFYAVNGPINSTSVNDTQLSVDDPATHQTYTMDLLATLKHHQQLASFPISVQKRFTDSPLMNSEAEIENAKEVAKYLGIPEEGYLMHWWSCFELDDQSMVHFDLCGPAYGKYEYERTIAGKRSPVFLVEMEQVVLRPHPSKDYAHKFTMTHMGTKTPGRSVPLPVGFLPFAQEKVNLEVSPLDVMQKRIGCPQGLQSELAAALVHRAISEALREGQPEDLKVTLRGIVKRPQLNGCHVCIICIADDRVGVELESGEKIQVLPEKLVVTSPRSQFLTLEEMTRYIQEEDQRHYDQALAPGDIVSFHGLTSGGYLNGREGIVVEGIPHTGEGGEARYVVKVSGELKKVRRKNLNLQQRKVESQSEIAQEHEILRYLTEDPLGSMFYQRVVQAGSMGISNLTDPELLPAFQKLVEMKMPETFFKSPPVQRQWEAILCLSKKPHFQDFRTQVLQRFRGRMTDPAELSRLLESKPVFADFYSQCISQGFLGAKGSQ